MTTTNGSPPDFTHKLQPFTFEGFTFRRVKIPARAWAETLARVGTAEQNESKKKTGSVLFAVSGEGLYELVSLGIHPDDLPKWNELWEAGSIEFGELADLRDWMWEAMTERPFTSPQPSSDGPGASSAASSKGESPSPVEVQRG